MRSSNERRGTNNKGNEALMIRIHTKPGAAYSLERMSSGVGMIFLFRL